ncbi:caspase family protein [Marimonas sp. MJW-29]|uniref:Caspase family protein n=1 Tax=Sulfitobacter sediminis TaxID=3234186 RepID=A0ABV3RRU7_9RHOB
MPSGGGHIIKALRIENGFSFQSAPVNSLISFSTAPGAVALDGEGENSPYTASLVEATQRFPEHDVANVLPIVRARVFDETNGFQVPWESSSLLRPVFLSSQAQEEPPLEIAAAAVQEPAAAPVVRDGSATASVTIIREATVQRHVPVFGAEDIQKMSGQGPFTVGDLPKSGKLGVRSGDRIRLLQPGEQLGLAAVSRLTYSPELPVVKATAAADLLTDTVRLQTGSGAVEVTLNLTYHACDLAAASPLDPQGVGLVVENFELIPDEAVAACSGAVAAYPNESRFHYQLSRAQSAKRDYDAAEASVRAALEMDHTRAHLGLGQIRRNRMAGIGADVDRAVPDVVRQHYLDGHNEGDPMATYLLGHQMIRYGETAAARESGFALLHRSKDAGYVEALNELARYFLLAEDGNANPQRGLQYLEESGARGNNFGFNSLGVVYKNGVGGITPDVNKAVESFTDAADLGHPTAPTSLGRVYAEGQLVAPDFPRALRWYEEGLRRADPWGGVNAATLILLDKIPGAGKPEAAILSAKAAALRTDSARRAAFEQLEGLSRSDLARGLQSFLVALGQPIAVDGQPGRQTEQAIVEVYGALVPLDSKADVIAALVKVAEAHWRMSDVRVDLI